MRFISKFGRFGVQVRPMIAEAYAAGHSRVVQEGVYALFTPGGLTPIEREMALARWSFNGSLQEQDEVTIVQPDYRIGVFDSEQAQIDNNWDDDIRKMVEGVLIDHAERHDDVIVVRSIIPPPWPRYDEFRGTPQALVRRLIEDGHNLDSVLTYERDHQNRPKVVEEIEKAIESGGIEVDVEEVIG